MMVMKYFIDQERRNLSKHIETSSKVNRLKIAALDNWKYRINESFFDFGVSGVPVG
jgi:hypothetical protein